MDFNNPSTYKCCIIYFSRQYTQDEKYCQKCHCNGHWTFECKKKMVFLVTYIIEDLTDNVNNNLTYQDLIDEFNEAVAELKYYL